MKNDKDTLNRIIDSFSPLKPYKKENNNELVPIKLLVVDAQGDILSFDFASLGLPTMNQDNQIKSILATYTTTPGKKTLPSNIINNLPPFSVTDIEIGLVTIRVYDADILYLEKYLLKKGKGNYGTGGTPLTEEDLELVYRTLLSAYNILDPFSTTYVIPTLAGVNIVDYINNGTTSYIVKPKADGDTLFIVGEGDNTSMYLFTGTPGTYGFNANNISASDLYLLPNDSTVPSLDNVTQVGNITRKPIIFQTLSSSIYSMLSNLGIRYFNNGFSSILTSDPLTANRVLKLPNKSGTLALEGESSGVSELYTEDFVVAIDPSKSFGKYKNGDTIPATGLTKEEFITMVVTETLVPTFIAPTLQAFLSDYVIKEVGTNYTANLSANFDRGLIKGKLVGGIWNANATQDFRAGDAVDYVLEGQVSVSNTRSVNRTLVLGDNTFTTTVNYDVGPQPKDSLGNDYTSPLPAGSITSTITIQSRRRYFYGSSVVNPTTSAIIRGLSNKIFDTAFIFSININTTKYVIALHSSRTLSSVITANNENITNDFVLTNVMVADAGGTTSSYNVYTLTTAVPLNLTANVILS